MKEILSSTFSPKSFLKDMLSSAPTHLWTSWQRFSKFPGGKQIFSKLIGQYIPYTGSIKPMVQKISPDHVVVSMKDTRSVRNHLKSLHAIAIANLGELSTGLALNSQLKDNAKSILTKLEIEYLKKARGTITSEVHFKLPNSFDSDSDFRIEAEIKNDQSETVAKVFGTWRVRL